MLFVSLGSVEPLLVTDLDRSSLDCPANASTVLTTVSHVPQATTTVYVTILDENDNAPTFRQQLYEVTLDEGPSSLNATLVTVQALDQDEGPNGTVAYAITEGNILGTFHIDNATVSTAAGPAPNVSLSLSLHCQLLCPVLAGGDPHGEGAGLRDQPRALHPGGHRHRPVSHRLAPADVNCHGEELAGGLQHPGLSGVREFPRGEQFHISFPVVTSCFCQLWPVCPVAVTLPPQGCFKTGSRTRDASGLISLVIWSCKDREKLLELL